MPTKAQIVDHYRSQKISSGPHAVPDAARALRLDPRYRRLQLRLEAAGFFEPARGAMVARIIGVISLFALAFSVQSLGPAWPVRVLCHALLGFAIVQGTFIAHEAAHGGVSRDRRVVSLVGQLFNTLFAGYGFTYFRRSHDLHHSHCNEDGVDPDIVSPLVSLTPQAAIAKRGIGRWFSRFQHVLIPMFALVWTNSMKLDGITYAIRNRSRLDLLVLTLHAALWFGVGAWTVGLQAAIENYLGWSAFAGIYLLLIIPVNHVGLPAIAPGAPLPFLEQQLATSRNVGVDSPLLDVLCIGLNSQIEHHLFPWVTSTRLRRGRAVTRAFCREEGLPYHEAPYGAAIATVFRVLRALGQASAAGQTTESPDGK